MTPAFALISSMLMKSPCPAPGHDWQVVCHAASDARFDFQNGHVRHCFGRAEYTRHCLVWASKNVQSPPGCSLSDTRLPYSRVWNSRISPTDFPSTSAICAISSSSTQTTPGSPVQQFPHCVQRKRSPSAYQGCDAVLMIRSRNVPCVCDLRSFERQSTK